MREASPLLPGVHWCDNAYDAATGADVLVLITEWNEFRALDFSQLGQVMHARVLVDLRNVYRPEEAAAAGFQYSSIGRR
jgi:UDPglucose 6-dehydrogenase